MKRKKPKKPASGETTTAVDEVAPARVIGIVVNRVRTARKIFDRLRRRKGQFRDPLDPASGDAFSSDHLAETILLTGRMRPFDRDELLYRTRVAGERGWLRWIEAGRSGPPPRPVFVVATQTVEVGADLDFDALVTEVAPLDCLRQRFGRLDRRGARRTSRALILGKSTDLGKTAEDRVYGTRLSATWQWLDKNASGKGKGKTIDFGISAMEERLADADLGSLCATVPDAPTLLPPYVALWARTNPAPAADPDVDPFLHGPNTAPADVQVVWRADLLQPGETELKRTRIYLNTLAMLPPTSMEACSVPIYEVQRWLDTVGASEGQNAAAIGDLADVEGGQLVETRPSKSAKTDKLVVRWKGAEDSLFGHAKDIRPGDTIVVPASYGGHDKFGWQPASPEVQDVADNCSRWGRARAMIRLHPSLFTERQWGSIPLDVLPSDEDHIEDALLALSEFEKLPEALRRSSAELVDQKTRWIMPYATPFGSDRPWVVVGKKRLTIDELLQETHGEVNDQVEETLPEDDVVSSLSGSGEPTTLAAHTDGVVWHVALFASLAGIDPAIASDLRLVAEWHDIGKVDERFQTLLHNGDYVSAVMALASGQPLAKSGRTYRDRAAGQRAAASAGVPKKFRHEALTVVLLRETELQQVLNGANDSELVEYLSGSHHGNGRASHPVVVDSPPAIETAWRSHKVVVDTETQLASAPYRLDNDWEGLFVRMNRRYGWWGLAWLEAIFRLADHCQSALDAAKPQVASKESIV